METYNGHVRTPNDAIILFEACRLGLLPRVQRRLSEKERQSIRSGSVFVWDEREAGMRRWTDGKSWSASRVSGSFLTYREMEGKRGGNSFVTPVGAPKTPESGPNSAEDPNAADGEEGPDGYRYKPDGLMKQSFSLTTSQGQHLHLISYYSRSHPTAQVMRQPSNDPSLSSIQIPKGMYPESTVADASNTPAVTRSPMPGAPNYVVAPGPAYAHQPPPHGYFPGFIPHPSAGYMYPLSPIHTPPGHYPLYAHPGMPPLAYAPAHYAAHPPPLHHLSTAPPSAYDHRPLRNSLPQSIPPPRLNGSTTGPPASLSPRQASAPLPPYGQAQSNGEQTDRRSSGPQVDPRLNEQPASVAPQTSGFISVQQERSQRPPETVPTTASQAPTIGSLVHSLNTLPPAPEKDKDRGSESPGGTKYGAPPQDIPNEKLAFREDKMALSKLDRVFARV